MGKYFTGQELKNCLDGKSERLILVDATCIDETVDGIKHNEMIFAEKDDPQEDREGLVSTGRNVWRKRKSY